MPLQMPLHMPPRASVVASLLEKPKRVSKPKSWIGTAPIYPLNPSMVKYREYLYRLAKYQKYLVDLENYKKNITVEISNAKLNILQIAAKQLNTTFESRIDRKRKRNF